VDDSGDENGPASAGLAGPPSQRSSPPTGHEFRVAGWESQGKIGVFCLFWRDGLRAVRRSFARGSQEEDHFQTG
jgi:hypothetical protein